MWAWRSACSPAARSSPSQAASGSTTTSARRKNRCGRSSPDAPRSPPAPTATAGASAPSGGRRSERDRPKSKGNFVEGSLHLHRDGFGFVHPSSGEGEDIFVPPEQAAKAVDNDRVLVEVVPSGGGRTAGR